MKKEKNKETSSSIPVEIGIPQHAVLYALICKSCFQNACRKEAEDIVREVTETYGRKRGNRMRLLTAENGEDIDMNSFLIHAEWQGKKDENQSRMYYENDRTVSEVTKCAWYEAWKKYDLLKYGSYYCRYIDKAICEAYDGGFELNVSSVLSQGESSCRFEWTKQADEKTVTEGKADSKWILPFSFHCRELYRCAQEVLKKHSKTEILLKIQAEFIKIFPDTVKLFGKEEDL